MTAGAPAGGRHAAHGRSAGRHRARRRLRRTAVRLALAVLAVAGGVLAVGPDARRAAPAAPAAAAAAVSTQVPVRTTRVVDHAAAPVRVRVPAIDVASDLVRLRVGPDRELVPPADFARAGWFPGGPAPGETGPAVIAGHVDSYEGPAVFFRLGDLSPGDEVLVDRADGSTARFQVRSVHRYPKDAFPTHEVYGPTPRAELRLITCGGAFDADARSYRDNVVVSAVLV